MENTTLSFYESLVDYYHLLFEDWDSSIARQAKALNALLSSALPSPKLEVLDCACGIGTQAIGFAQYGHCVVGSDLSPAAVTRAKQEAERRGLQIRFFVSDMTNLTEISDGGFDVVAVLDNALPHLNSAQLKLAVRAMRSKLNSEGLLIASMRDYDQLIVEKPKVQRPAFYGQQGARRIVHQVWDWVDESNYIAHLYITEEEDGRWNSHHFTVEYRCLLRKELTETLADEGFEQVRWLMPEESGFYQPLVIARM